MNSHPLVSVILPVYNGANYVRQAIDSVFAQTLQDFELIVIDDGSTDETPAIVKEYGSRLSYHRQENQGAGAAFNHGLLQSKGHYVGWLSHDDLYAPSKLERQVAALERLGREGLSYTHLRIMDAEGNPRSDWKLPEYRVVGEAVRYILTKKDICMAPYSLLYNRSCVDAVGFYDVSLRYSQDVDYLVRLALRFPLILVPEYLTWMREHPRRGMRANETAVARDDLVYARKWFAKLGPNELYPEKAPFHTRRERATVRLRMGDELAGIGEHYSQLAVRQYLMAVKEWPPMIRYAWPLIRRCCRRSPADGVR